MWSLLSLIKVTIWYIFYASLKTGQFIVTTLQALLTINLHFLKKLHTLVTIIIEDFTVFIQDVGQRIANVVWGISYTGECITAGITASLHGISKVFQSMYDLVFAVYNAGVGGLLTVINSIKTLFLFVKQTIILFGDGVWFIIVFVPKSILSLIPLTFHYGKSVCFQTFNSIYDNVKSIRNLGVELVYDCYYFLTDVPVESVIGIIIAVCFIYIFVQFYSIMFLYLRNKMSSFLYRLRLKYHQLKSALNRRLSQNNKDNSLRNVDNDEASTSTKLNVDACCIICQEYEKCVLVLPCKHLCLCSNCTPRLMRYSKRCPICRNRINSTMKVFT